MGAARGATMGIAFPQVEVDSMGDRGPTLLAQARNRETQELL